MKKIPKLIFGKKNLVQDEIFGDEEIGYSNGSCVSFPAIAGGKIKAEASIYGNVPVHIFSNGSEAEGWFSRNCYDCPKRNAEARDAMDIRKEGGCPLELRLAIAYIDDGKIPFKTAKRIGYSYLGIQENGVFVHLTICKEKP